MQYVEVYRGTYQSAPVQLARDFLTGSRDDYLFFRTGQWEYILLEGNLPENTLTFEDVDIYKMIYQNGTPDHEPYWQVFGLTEQDISISNPYQMQFYGSAEGQAHLREGGESYALALLLLGICFCMCCLFWSVTVWLYRRR